MTKDKPPGHSSYLKYSGLAFQMFFILIAGWWIGAFLDKQIGWSESYLGGLLPVLFLIGFFYKLYIQLTNE